MKTNIKFFAVIAVLVIGFFLPLVLVALGFAFSWTIAIVAGIACEIGVCSVSIAVYLAYVKLVIDLEDSNKKIEKLLSESKEELK